MTTTDHCHTNTSLEPSAQVSLQSVTQAQKNTIICSHDKYFSFKSHYHLWSRKASMISDLKKYMSSNSAVALALKIR